MKTQLRLLGFLMLTLTWNAAFAERFYYPGHGKTLFSVNIPRGWQTSIEGDILHAGPRDDSVYLGFLGVHGRDMQEAAAAADQVIAELVHNFQVENEDSMTVNGMPFIFLEGSGRYVEGGPINASVAIFSPDGYNFCLIMYFAQPFAELRHEDTLIRIVQSIQPG